MRHLGRLLGVAAIHACRLRHVECRRLLLLLLLLRHVTRLLGSE